MRPGALVHTVQIEADVIVDLPNGGQEATTEAVYLDEPAAIAPITAVERERGGVQSAEATHAIRTWYLPDVTPAMRVLYLDPHAGRLRKFEILTVQNVGEAGIDTRLEVVERVT